MSAAELIRLLPELWKIEEDADGVTSAAYPKQTFVLARDESVTVYGHFLTRVHTRRLAMAERFSGRDAPFKLANGGNSIAVTVKLSQESTLLGQWVAVDGFIGVVAALPGNGKAEVHVVGAEGLTERVLLVNAQTIVPAAWEQIPQSRRPGGKLAAKLGYR